MKLTREASAIVGRSSIGMLALRSRRLPLVNPAVFSFASGSLWMTTSRYAAKTIIAKRDPRAAFLVDAGSKAVLLRGALEVFDPLQVSSQIRAMLGRDAPEVERRGPHRRRAVSTGSGRPRAGCPG
ncbi:MAG: hypothetical protein AUG94_00080 [Actinobacteria bacterium 13_1_20CM_4_66_15]|nr:MAG: hypothetical protein AUG94_00080 [Actinobacteria bacterium 13_1_20CM_4_66_15]